MPGAPRTGESPGSGSAALVGLFLLLLSPTVQAARVRVHAEVRADLQTIVGEIKVEGDGIRLLDTQALLPMPEDDRQKRRTFPNDSEQGFIHLEEISEQRFAFHSILPARYDAMGKVPGRGLYVNGSWLPQPVSGNELAEVDWVVELELPPDTLGVLNGTPATRELRWTGRATRLSLAVIPKANAAILPLTAGQVAVVSDRHISDRFVDRLTAILEDAWPGPEPPTFVVVVAPLRRRLVRTGPGVLYVSDRAFRVTDGLWQYHVSAVRRGLLDAGLLTIDDAFERAFAATALADARTAQPDMGALLGWASWVPQIDALLYSGSLPYYSDIFDETYGGDPIHDDLVELFGGLPEPARAITRRIDARYGAGTSEQIAKKLLSGEAWEPALVAVGVDPSLVREWRTMGPDQNLHLEVRPEADGTWTAEIRREVTVDAPPIPVPIRVGEETITWHADRGPDVELLKFDERPPDIRVDPDSILQETRSDDDRFPTRWTATVAAFPYELNFRSGRITAFANVAVRRQYDTRWLFDASAATDPEDIVSLSLGAVRYLGPLTDRRNRPFRLVATAGPSLLDPSFRPVDGGRVALGAGLSGIWESRVENELPSEGHRLSLTATGGVIPGGDDRWGSLSLRAVKLVPLTGRLTGAVRTGAGIASGGVEHRLLALGGTGNVQAIPDAAVVGEEKVSSAFELRWEALRHASIPLPLVWVSALQISGGLDHGILWADDGRYQALGWAGGLFFVGDVLGAEPNGVGVWVAGPLAWSPDELVTGPGALQVYGRLTQAF